MRVILPEGFKGGGSSWVGHRRWVGEGFWRTEPRRGRINLAFNGGSFAFTCFFLLRVDHRPRWEKGSIKLVQPAWHFRHRSLLLSSSEGATSGTGQFHRRRRCRRRINQWPNLLSSFLDNFWERSTHCFASFFRHLSAAVVPGTSFRNTATSERKLKITQLSPNAL